jgi:hypothetical protein
MTEPLGRPKLITLHWTAGNHKQTFPEYHFCVQGDGTVVPTLPLGQKGAHTWMRNTGNIGTSMCAMAAGHPVTPIQIERNAKLVAELCLRFGLDPRGHVELPELKLRGGTLVATGRTIIAPVIADHAFFAKADGYYPDRWDVGEKHEVILKKALWYFDKLTAHAIPLEFIK